MTADAAAAVDRALDSLAREEGVAVLFAVESGSRAWDFASPDSDWDVRFVYARPTQWHLWLQSPVLYRADPGMLRTFRDLAATVPARPAALHHYRNLMRRQWDRELAEGAEVKLKRYLYAVRPALALRWMAQHPQGDPPMALPTLLEQTSLPDKAREALGRLVVAKRGASELGTGLRIPALDRLIVEELAARDAAEEVFRHAVAFADRVVGAHAQ